MWQLKLTLSLADNPDAALVKEAAVPPTIEHTVHIVTGEMEWTCQSYEVRVGRGCVCVHEVWVYRSTRRAQHTHTRTHARTSSQISGPPSEPS
jgi:hypothetical protein